MPGARLERGGPAAFRLDAIALAAVLLLFCAPLFIKLGTADLANDEAVYAYAVDRMLETGDWLTPRSIPSDGAFLEKPPLKFWLVAAPIEAGLLPHNEFGMRFFDALAGAAALVYVFLFGRAFAGPLCGVIAVFVLVTQGQLVYVHGIRSNNMESALLLSYCAGLFHFTRWTECGPSRSASRHAIAAAAFFVLGFMTKFVAALFLPLVCGLALVWRKDGSRLVARRWREWSAPVILTIVAAVPWFAYQTAHFGTDFWSIMFGQHVVRRLTSSLDVHHLHPWNFYFMELWRELYRAGSQVIVAIGVCALVWSALRRSWLARVLLLWAVVPLAIISAGTSKRFHYAYPFLPPLALGAGFVVAQSLRGVDGVLMRLMPALAREIEALRLQLPATQRWRRVAVVFGALALVVAGWTAAMGFVLIEPGGVRLFKNASVWRPLLVTLVLWWFAGQGRLALRCVVAIAFLACLPWRGYEQSFSRLRVSVYPLRAVGNCVRTLWAAQPIGTPGIYNATKTMTSHSYFYYWRDLGWVNADVQGNSTELRRRLLDKAAQSPILLSTRDYDAWRQSDEAREITRWLGRQPGGVSPDFSLVVLLPGPYDACIAPAMSAGARPIGGTPKAIGEGHAGLIGSDRVLSGRTGH